MKPISLSFNSRILRKEDPSSYSLIFLRDITSSLNFHFSQKYPMDFCLLVGSSLKKALNLLTQIKLKITKKRLI